MMENNLFQKFCGSIDYNTYMVLQKNSYAITIGLSLVSRLIPQSSELSSSICVLSFASLATYLGLICSNGQKYTKDIIQIRNLYEEYLKNYNNLNHIFDLNNPVEIHTMFNYLLYEGYLSKNKEIQNSKKEVRDLDGLLGVDVINGNAVCRHISAMLTDILNVHGIESMQLSVYSNPLEQLKYIKNELINWARTNITDEKDYESSLQFIDKFVDEEKQNIKISLGKKQLNSKKANHAISFAFKDGKNYFLDLTKNRIYRMNEVNNNILCDNECGDVLIQLATSKLLNSREDYKKLKKFLLNSYPSITREEEQRMVKETINKCKGNIDIFEKFYSENCELYDDISSKVLCIKKTNSKIK